MDAWVSIIWVAVGGSLGAVCRYALATLLSPWQNSGIAIGTLAANLLGCFLMGLLIGSDFGDRYAAAKFAVGIGFLGSLTTFSTFSADTVNHLTRQQYFQATGYVAASVFIGLLLTYVGISLAGGFQKPA